jgi:hypothetical protein
MFQETCDDQYQVVGTSKQLGMMSSSWTTSDREHVAIAAGFPGFWPNKHTYVPVKQLHMQQYSNKHCK